MGPDIRGIGLMDGFRARGNISGLMGISIRVGMRMGSEVAGGRCTGKSRTRYSREAG